jgi:nucleotide-binding universal stress UspA family protein
MLNVLLPVDGSEQSERSVDRFIKTLEWYKGGVDLHLLNVQHQIPGGERMASLIGHEQLRGYHHDEGMQALQGARAKLDAAGIKYQYHISVGEPAELIVQYAREKRSDQIVMGARGAGAVEKLLLGSVVTRVIGLSEVPVLVVK